MNMHGTEAFLDLATELLARGHRVRFGAEGGSMHPSIRAGEALVVEPVGALEIRMDDVVLYRSGRRVIAHRVVGIVGNDGKAPVFALRGDAPGSAHERVEARQVLGRVAAVERGGWVTRLKRAVVNRLNARAIAAVAMLLLAFFGMPVTSALAKATSWNVAGGGAWTTAGNWSNGVPVAGDDVTFPADVAGGITNVPTITLNSLVINGNTDLRSNPTGNTITISTLFTVAAGKTLLLGAATDTRLEFTLAATATGTIEGTVDIQSGNNGPRTFTNNGDLTLTATGLITNTGALPSSFVNAAGATLRIGSAAGITTGGGGNIQTDNRTFSAAANYVYNGVANQATGNGLPTNLTGSLTIDNPGNTVTLSNARTIASGGTVNLTNGTFAAGANLTMANNTTINRSGGSMTGTPQGGGAYDVNYTGNSKTTGTELAGTGLRNVTVNLTAGQTLTLNANRAPDGNLVMTSGTFDVSTFTFNRSGAGGSFTMAAGTTLRVGGANNFPANYTTTTLNAASTVNYYRTNIQTVSARTYGNLVISGSNTKTTAGATNVAGNLTITDGPTFSVTNTLNVTGTTTVGGGTSGTLNLANTTGAKLFTGLVTVNAGGTWTEAAAEDIIFRGGITNNGTFTASTGIHEFNVNNQALTGTFTIPVVTVTGVTLTNNNSLTVNNNLSGTGGLTQAANATLNVGGTAAITTLTATAVDNTVNYTGAAAQTIPGTTYYYLNFTGGAKTTNGATGLTVAAGGAFDQGCTVAFTAAGTFTVNGSYINCNSSTLGGTGNLTVGGIAVNGGGTFDYIGAAGSTPTITIGTAGVVNNGIMRVWGGGRVGGEPQCPSASQVSITAGASRSWSGTGNFHLTNVRVTNQNATVPITAWNSTNVAGNTGLWTFTTGTCEFNSPTAVKVNSFAATRTADGVRISLKTSRDVNNLGFNLYREVEGKRVKLNASLLAGTALMGGAGTSFTAGQSRRWLDRGGQVGAVYWLEEVDLSGAKTWYGPAVAAAGVMDAKTLAAGSGPAQALLATHPRASPAGALDEDLEAALTLARVGKAGTGSALLKATAKPVPPSPTPAPTPTPQAQTQFALAAGAAVRLDVKAEGWYRVTQPQLLAAGLSPRVDPRTLQLFVNGAQLPIHVESAVEGTFGEQDAVHFYGLGIDSTWSDKQAYWLVAGSGYGLRMVAASGAAGTARGRAGNSFPATIAWKPRTLYFAALLNGDGNNFFGPVVTDEPTSQELAVSRLDASGGPSSLQVKLQGGTAGPHAVRVALNGTVLGTALFSGQESGVATFPVPALNEGANILTLTSSSPDDVSAVDEVRLTYPHRYTAEGDALRFTAQAGVPVTIDGFSAPSITVIDVTDPASPSLVKGQASGSGSNFALTILPAGGGTRTLLAVAASQVRTPTLDPNGPSSWHAAQDGYDLVIVGHASLLANASPLAALRQSQGLKVATIDVQDLYDEFGFGVKSPHAIKAFLATARSNWQVKPRFVLLLGNGTFDPRGFLETGVPDLVPAKMVDTRLLETASDDWFVDFDDDGLPDMAIGRLPAESAAEANRMVGRTVAYDPPVEAAWGNRVLLVSGENQEPKDDFASLSAAVKAVLPGEIVVTELVHGATPNPASSLVSAINAGQVLVNYIGHGSTEVWGGGLFDFSAALGLSNGTMSPVVLSMTCLNGSFHDVYTAPLGKALLNAPGGGAVAVWASSGLSEPGPQSAINKALVRSLYANPGMTIGQAAAAAKAATGDLDVRRTWILLGDPSAHLQ